MECLLGLYLFPDLVFLLNTFFYAQPHTYIRHHHYPYLYIHLQVLTYKPIARLSAFNLDQFKVCCLATEQPPTLVPVLTAGTHTRIHHPIEVDREAIGHPNVSF